MKVYVITKGKYSDYHICGVALDIEHANQIAELCTDRDNFYEPVIEEWDTDKFSPILQGNKLYDVSFYGNNMRVCERDSIEYFIDNVNEVRYSNTGYFVRVIAKDKTHATKIAADLIRQYKIEKELGV